MIYSPIKHTTLTKRKTHNSFYGCFSIFFFFITSIVEFKTVEEAHKCLIVIVQLTNCGWQNREGPNFGLLSGFGSNLMKRPSFVAVTIIIHQSRRYTNV